METSAKASINVEEAFFTLARDIKAKMEKKLVICLDLFSSLCGILLFPIFQFISFCFAHFGCHFPHGAQKVNYFLTWWNLQLA